MAKDQALLKNAQVDLERYQVLFQQDSIPKQQLDTQESLVRQYEATLKVGPSTSRQRQIAAHLLPHYRADQRPGGTYVLWIPGISCTPPIPTDWSSSPRSNRSP